MQLTMCGIPRSGSTIVWQLMCGVFPTQTILKVHPGAWEPDNSIVVATIRNPYDVAASLYRVRLSSTGKKVGGQFDLTSILKYLQDQFKALPKILRKPSILLRYEMFYSNYSVIFRGISEITEYIVPEEVQFLLSEKYSLEANKKRAEVLSSFKEHDKNHIHGDHIGAIHPNTWRIVLPEWAHSNVEAICAPIAEKWNYEN